MVYRKILLTGANGFVGKHILERLSKGYSVRILARKDTPIRKKNIEIYRR